MEKRISFYQITIFISLLMLSFILFSGCGTSQAGFNTLASQSLQAEKPTIVNSNFKDLNAQETFTLIENNENKGIFKIIDVRTPAEFSNGHIINAINIDYNAPDFNMKLLTLDKEGVYLVYCQAGFRSAKAGEKMLTLGFKEVYNLSGGIKEWRNAGYLIDY